MNAADKMEKHIRKLVLSYMYDGWKPFDKLENDKQSIYFLQNKYLDKLTIMWDKNSTKILILKNDKLNNIKSY